MDERLTAVFRRVPRSTFLPEEVRPSAAEDRALAIGFGATCSQPSTVATLLELLAVAPGHRVLDLGSGSGWTTALLSALTGPEGAVVGVELVPELVERSRAALRQAGCPARVELAVPRVLGLPHLGPFDRILVSAEASSVPESLTEQLADGGRLVVPVGDRLTVIDRVGPGLRRSTAPGRYRFVPLLD